MLDVTVTVIWMSVIQTKIIQYTYSPTATSTRAGILLGLTRPVSVYPRLAAALQISAESKNIILNKYSPQAQVVGSGFRLSTCEIFTIFPGKRTSSYLCDGSSKNE